MGKSILKNNLTMFNGGRSMKYDFSTFILKGKKVKIPLPFKKLSRSLYVRWRKIGNNNYHFNLSLKNNLERVFFSF